MTERRGHDTVLRTADVHQSRFESENGEKVFGRSQLQQVSEEGRGSTKAEGGIP